MKKKIFVFALLFIVTFSVFASVTKEEAEEIALSDSRVSRESLAGIRSHLDWERGERVYDVEFYADGVKYEYEIALSDGRILSSEREAGRMMERPQEGGISREEALSIALDNAGLSDRQINNLKVKLERDHGADIYEIEFRSGSFSYEYDISIFGEILKCSIERRGSYGRPGSNQAVLSRSDAEVRLLSYLPGGIENVRISRDYNRRGYKYEAKAYYDGIEYEVEIDGTTGEIIKYEQEMKRR